jgi:hypothetical protein
MRAFVPKGATTGQHNAATRPKAGETFAVDAAVRATKHVGKPMSEEVRSGFENRLGYDFSTIRIHDDSDAASAAQGVNARAYTRGHDIVFGAGEFAPRTTEGRWLLVHELAHFVQQTAGANGRASAPAVAPTQVGSALGLYAHFSAPQGGIQRKGKEGESPDPAERQADAAADAVIKAGAAAAGRTSAPPVSARPSGAAATPRDPDWDPAYQDRTVYPQTYAEYEKARPTRKATSEMAGAWQQRRTKDVTLEQLFAIFPDLKADADQSADVKTKVEGYVKNLNDAFRIMKLDTVQAQALYLAHAWAESNQFRTMTESQDPQKQRFLDDPRSVKLDEAYLKKKYPAGKKDDTRRATIDPVGNWAFVGHGPLQVTHQGEHLRTLAVLEKLAEQYESAGDEASKKNAATLREAVAEIKKDPREAANPKYAFLFSAGFMVMRGADTRTWAKQHYSFAGTGPESNWMTGTYTDPKGTGKSQAYDRAVTELSKDAEPLPKAKAAAPAAAKPGG